MLNKNFSTTKTKPAQEKISAIELVRQVAIQAESGGAPTLAPDQPANAHAPTLAEPALAGLTRGDGVLSKPIPARCITHTHPLSLIDVELPSRPGWWRSTCKLCGAFVGYRPKVHESEAMPEAKAWVSSDAELFG